MRVLRTVAVAFALCATTAAFAQARVEELMRKSGLWEQAAQMRMQMKGGVAEARETARAQGKPLLDDDQFARLSAAIDRTFSADVLRESMTLYMEELVQPADQAEVMKWLASDLGGRFTRWEVAAGHLDEVKKGQVEAPKILATLPKARLEKYQRLSVALDAGNTVATLTIKLTKAIIFGIASVTPGTDANAAALGIEQRLQAQRAQMAQLYTQRSLQTYAYVYRNATDAQMESYVRFAESDVARRYHAAGIKAIDESISQAAIALGQDLAGGQRRNPS